MPTNASGDNFEDIECNCANSWCEVNAKIRTMANKVQSKRERDRETERERTEKTVCSGMG